MLTNIKLLLNLTDSSKDSLLLVLIDQCTQDAVDYTHNNVPGEMSAAIEQLVIYRYNSLGTENLTSENYSGLSYSYNDYESYRDALLKKYRKLRVY